jgi:putative methionine-R-sulfoxide reductase with GAF domain
MTDRDILIAYLEQIVSSKVSRVVSLQAVADTIRHIGGYRWVGLYDVDHVAGMVRNVVFSGPGAPEYPQFPIDKGLTGAAVAERRTINVGNVAADARYLTALGSTQAEIIVPIFDRSNRKVIGTIDVASELRDAFNAERQALLERSADVVSPLWQQSRQ